MVAVEVAMVMLIVTVVVDVVAVVSGAVVPAFLSTQVFPLTRSPYYTR